MPKFKPSYTNQKTTSGVQVSIGEIHTNDNDSVSYSTLMKDYDRMRNGDPIISGLLEFLKLPILSTGHRLEYDKESPIENEMALLVDETLNTIGFHEFKYHALLSTDYGNSIFEYVWDYGTAWNGKILNRLVKLSPIQNYTIERYYFNDSMVFKGLRLYRYAPDGKQELIDISDDKLLIHTHNQEFGDIRGRSILRPMRKYWLYKESLIDSGTRLATRGGTPFIKHSGNDSKTVANAQTIGRTLGNSMRGGYITAEKDKFDVEILDIKGQEHLLPLLEYADKQTFYGTLSQFMMSGIGQSGSRAATSEHKSSYELMAGYIMTELESTINNILIPKIISNSPYAFIDAPAPVLKFDSLTSIDIQKIAPNVINLFNSNVVEKTPEDEVFIREMFGLPSRNEIQTLEIEKKEIKQLEKKKRRELTEFERNIFELESAIDHFETTQEKTEGLLTEFTKKIIDDMIVRFKEGRETTPRFKGELILKLKKIFDEGLNRGFRDVKKEVSKLTKTKKLSTDPLEIPEKLDSQLVRAVNRLYSDIQFTFDEMIDSKKDKLEKGARIDDYFTGVDSWFATRKRAIVQDVQTSYSIGREEGFKKENVSKWVYSAILDENVCNICAPMDQMELTKKEIDNKGLRLRSPVNDDCLGGKNCRCLLIPSEVE